MKFDGQRVKTGGRRGVLGGGGKLEKLKLEGVVGGLRMTRMR